MAESITVSWLWQPIGHVSLVNGKLIFPPVSNVAGINRFTFLDASGVQTGQSLDFAWKTARVLVERAAELTERNAGAPVLNR